MSETRSKTVGPFRIVLTDYGPDAGAEITIWSQATPEDIEKAQRPGLRHLYTVARFPDEQTMIRDAVAPFMFSASAHGEFDAIRERADVIEIFRRMT